MSEVEENGQKKESKKKVPWFALFVLLNLSALAGGVFLTYLGVYDNKMVPISEEELWDELHRDSFFEIGEPILLAMEPITLNLLGSGHVLNIEVNLELASEGSFEEVMSKRSAARDTVLRILYKKTYQDIESVQGKLHLKDQMIQAINSILDQGVVRDIFFSQFVVERR